MFKLLILVCLVGCIYAVPPHPAGTIYKTPSTDSAQVALSNVNGNYAYSVNEQKGTGQYLLASGPIAASKYGYGFTTSDSQYTYAYPYQYASYPYQYASYPYQYASYPYQQASYPYQYVYAKPQYVASAGYPYISYKYQ